MKGWFCPNPTGVDTLEWREAPDPQPGPGQVRVRVHAASLNFPDLLIVENKYQFKPEPPFVPGSEFCGVVEAVGEGVTTLQVGQRVAALGGHGGFGTHALAAEGKCVALPDDFPFVDGAAFVMTYGTTQHALFDRGRLQPGETLLVLGAVGGVASTDEKCAIAKQLGADETINYSTEDLREALKRITGGKGPDVIYDPVGDKFAEPAFRSIAWRGRYLVIGFAGGEIPKLPLNLPLLKSADIVGVFWGEYARREPEAYAKDKAQLLQWFKEGKIKPLIDQTMPMSRLHDAYAHMAARGVKGKLVLVNED
jgi:NADPH2:quinone reductase